MALDRERALRELMELLNIEAGPAKEKPVADWLRARFKSFGVKDSQVFVDEAQHQSEYGGDTGNVIVRFDGHGKGPRRLLSTHMDTVPLAVGAKPRLDGDYIRNDAPGKALGGDNRLGCGVVLQAVRRLSELGGKHGPVTCVFLVQEEVGLVGARGLDVKKLGDPKPSLGFNFDSAEPQNILTKVIGTQRFEIKIAGKPAHAGEHVHLGVSASQVAAYALADLGRSGWHGKIANSEGEGSANAGILRGGEGTNVVVPEFYILAEARAWDPQFRKRIVEKWKEVFTKAAAEVKNEKSECASVSFGPGPGYEAFAIPDEAPVVQEALAVTKAAGLQGKTYSNKGGVDANHLNAHGIPTVTFGCGMREVHTAKEYIVLKDYYDACQIALNIVASAARA